MRSHAFALASDRNTLFVQTTVQSTQSQIEIFCLLVDYDY